jgi:hypothetical protein
MISQDSAQEQLGSFNLDDTATCYETIPSSFVLDHTTTDGEIDNHRGFNAIDVEKMNSNLSEEDKEMFKLMLRFSSNIPFINQSTEPASKKLIHGISEDLPPPTIFKRRKNLGSRSSTK